MIVRTEADREHLFSRRAVLLGAGMAGAGVMLAGRMAYLSVFEQEKYKLLAEDNRVAVRLIPPRRGWIVDRKGRPLALNRPDYRLELVPELVDDLDATLAEIARVIPLDAEALERIHEDIKAHPRYVPVEVADKLDWQSFAAINVRLPELPGVQPVRGFARWYPDGPAVGHLLGYVGAPTREQFEETKDPLYVFPGFRLGKDGIEKALDTQLKGEAGARRVEVNARGRILRELETIPDKQGDTVRLTIDQDLQAYAARRIGDESASVVVMDCWTGEVLCMVSMPAFDPNSFSDGIGRKEWADLMANDHHPLINKSVQGVYPPGSTFKMVTALAGLEAGVSPDWACGCNGRYWLGRHAFHCWRRGGHGRVDMRYSITQSCDVYYYTLGREIGIDAIAGMAKRLGLNTTYDELPVPTQRKGVIGDPEWKQRRYKKGWLTGETLNAAIGQGYTATTPLQLAVMAARLASGRAVTPRLLVEGRAPIAPSLGISAEHLQVIRDGMDQVVNSGRGTAGNARIRSDMIRMAGKTGSAQVKRITMADRRAGRTSSDALPWRFRDHALFVAFAPAEAPRYAAAVVVEHGSHGSSAAAPIARDVLQLLFEPAAAQRTLAAFEEKWAADRARIAAAEAAAERQAAAAATQATAPPAVTPVAVPAPAAAASPQVTG